MQNIEFLIAVFILSFLTYVALRSPSHDRKWSKDQKILPSISTYGGKVTAHNVRQARYRSIDDYDVTYTNWTFNLTDIEKVWFIVEPFGKMSLFGLRPAHIFMSFQLKSGMFLSISPEIRKKKGEKFSPFKSFFRSYEIMYVLADEVDVVKLRTNHRKDTVRVYPLTLHTAKVQQLFKNMALKVNSIHAKAAFFNTAVHSCSTNIALHLRNTGAKMPRYHILYLLPGTIDSILHDKGLIDTKLSLEKAREHFYVTKRAQKCTHTNSFSNHIRIHN